jgi:DNA modification methylase
MIEKQYIGNNYAIYVGDCVQVIKDIPDNSVHYQIHSPPFSSLYIYSDSISDMGNCANDEEFFEHYKFLIPELYRILIPGRLTSVHCKDLVDYKGSSGRAGLRDFSGEIIRAYESCGFKYHSRVTIWKDPVIEMQRTKSQGLLHKQVKNDSTMSRQGLPDYLLTFRKWPEDGTTSGPEPVTRPKGFDSYVGEDRPDFRGSSFDSIAVWQKYASPVWFDINQTNVLNAKISRSAEDEKHICLARGSLILTARGFIEIQDIEIGDLVLTHKGNWKPVTAKACTGINDTIKIHAQGVANLVVTPDHKILAREVSTCKPKQSMKSNEPSWIKAGGLGKSYVNLKLPAVVESDLSEKEWWIVGRYLADGHRGDREKKNGMKSFYISVGKGKDDCFLKEVGNNAGACHSVTCNQYRLKGLRDSLKDTLHACGSGAENKQIPIEGLCLNKEKSESLLSGYLSGDGHKDKSGRWHCSSVSRPLLLGMSMVAQRARSIIPAVYASKKPGLHTIEGRIVNQKQLWVMLFNDNPKHTFSEILEDGAWKKTRRIQSIGKNETWSIQVHDDESYTAEGCIVKNCPLQLDIIERAIHLWTNPNDVVFTPFAGVGSEIYGALKMKRRGIGIELKPEYAAFADGFCSKAENGQEQMQLFA